MTPKIRIVSERIRMVGSKNRRDRCSGVNFVAVNCALSLPFDFGLRLACSLWRVADIGGGGNEWTLAERRARSVAGIFIERRITD